MYKPIKKSLLFLKDKKKKGFYVRKPSRSYLSNASKHLWELAQCYGITCCRDVIGPIPQSLLIRIWCYVIYLCNDSLQILIVILYGILIEVNSFFEVKLF